MEKFTLDDIAGYEAEKRELKQIIAMFASYKEYAGRGARRDGAGRSGGTAGKSGRRVRAPQRQIA